MYIGLSPEQHQAVIWTSAGILLSFIQENAFENVVWKMVTILS